MLRRRPLRERGTAVAIGVVVVAVIVALFPDLSSPWSPRDCLIGRALAPPDLPGHPFGFDIQGCDLLGLTLLGARDSMLVGVGATVLSVLVAVPVGTLAAASGGWLDAAVGRFVDLVTGLPIVLVGLVLLSGIEERGPLNVIAVLAVAAWPIHTRVVRSVATRLDGEPYVDAARAMGASRSRVVRKHLVPGSLSALVPVLPTTVAFSIGVEAILSFLGAGLQLPAISWGVLLGEVRFNVSRAPHLMLPGVALLAVSGALVVLGEAWRSRPLGEGRHEAAVIAPGSAPGPPDGAGEAGAVTVLDPSGYPDHGR